MTTFYMIELIRDEPFKKKMENLDKDPVFKIGICRIQIRTKMHRIRNPDLEKDWARPEEEGDSWGHELLLAGTQSGLVNDHQPKIKPKIILYR